MRRLVTALAGLLAISALICLVAIHVSAKPNKLKPEIFDVTKFGATGDCTTAIRRAFRRRSTPPTSPAAARCICPADAIGSTELPPARRSRSPSTAATSPLPVMATPRCCRFRNGARSSPQRSRIPSPMPASARIFRPISRSSIRAGRSARRPQRGAFGGRQPIGVFRHQRPARLLHRLRVQRWY